MPNIFSTCTIALTFEYGRIDDRHMHLTVICNNQAHMLEPVFTDDVGTASITLAIELPTVLNFSVKNKGYNDTVVDQSGNILKDCYIKLVSVALDNIETNPETLGQKMFLTTESGQIVNSNYFGFNGEVTFPLHKPDVFSQVLTLNSYSN